MVGGIQERIAGPCNPAQLLRENDLKNAAQVGKEGLIPKQVDKAVKGATCKAHVALENGDISEALDWQAVAVGFENPQG